MGRGDKRTRKGKITIGSYGKTRRRKAQKAKKAGAKHTLKLATTA